MISSIKSTGLIGGMISPEENTWYLPFIADANGDHVHVLMTTGEGAFITGPNGTDPRNLGDLGCGTS